jgi:hypothetical protein
MSTNGIENIDDQLDSLKELVYQSKPLNATSSQVLQGEDLKDSVLQTQSSKETQSATYFLKQRVHLINVLVMSFMWACCSFNSYMISMYVKYLPGNIYVNTMASGGS